MALVFALLSHYSSAVPYASHECHARRLCGISLMQPFPSMPSSREMVLYCAVRLPLAFFLGVSAMVRSVKIAIRICFSIGFSNLWEWSLWKGVCR